MPPEFVTKDTGKREVTSTGALRERAAGKGRYDQIAPLAVARVARLYERGHVKYHDGRNWEKGQPYAWFADAAGRHAGQGIAGQVDEDHLAAAVWNLLAMMEYEERAKLGLEPYVTIMRQAAVDMGPLWRFFRGVPESAVEGMSPTP